MPAITSTAVSDASERATTASAIADAALATEELRMDRTGPRRSAVLPNSAEHAAAARNDSPMANPSPASPN